MRIRYRDKTRRPNYQTTVVTQHSTPGRAERCVITHITTKRH